MTTIYVDSFETDAPQITNASASLDAALHAFLVTGFKPQAASSLSVAAEVATITLPSHGYSDMRVLEVAGAAVASLNGKKFCRTPTGNTITFPAPGVPDGAVGGTITVKRASCGWSRPHSSGGVSVYARTDITATDAALWIDDSGSGLAAPTYARVRAVMDYSGTSTWLQQAPTEGQRSGGLFWHKGQNTSTPKQYVFVGDGKRFFLFIDGVDYRFESYASLHGPMGFGDLTSFHPGDAYHAFIAGGMSTTSDLVADGLGYGYTLSATPGSTNLWLFRASSQIGPPIQAGPLGYGAYMGANGPVFPSTVGNGLVLVRPVFVREVLPSVGSPIRGVLPGVANPVAQISDGSMHRQFIQGAMGSSAIWVLVTFQRYGSRGTMAFNLTEPWG